MMGPKSSGAARNGDVELYFDAHGDNSDPPVLFINGLGSQSINFLPAWVKGFNRAGFYVIRMDNRDVGLSSKTPGEPPSIDRVLEQWAQERSLGEFSAPYDLSDMAVDCLGVLDALEIEQTHVWGMSMGGMIAQTLAINHAVRLRSMTTVMSTTGEIGVGQSTPEAAARLAPIGDDRASVVANAVAARQFHGGTFFDKDWALSLEEAAYDRCHHPQGRVWQLLAVLASGSRAEQLPAITVATMVIHGRMDPLIQLDGGEATASLIPDAELVVHDKMGHDTPEPLWDDYIADLQRLADRAP
jgi:pimeloyl-ACP methyl ester carboxylesterase